MKTNDFYEDITDDVKKWQDTSSYNERRRKRPLPTGKQQSV